MRIGIDAMGGDNAPDVEVQGAIAACEFLGDDDRIVLVGDKAAIEPHLARAGEAADKMEIHHASERIGMDETPVEALRAKPDNSIGVMSQLHRRGEIDACISAGNTGACVAAAQMYLRRLPGVHRPGIAIVTPTYYGPVAICDVGANVNCRPQHLYQYGVMASVYVSAICGVENPRIALLSIGEEDAKGNELVKRTQQLFRGDPHLRFVGNAEGRDLFRGSCEVLVCDGFVGNVVLKLMEGMAEGVLRAMMEEMLTSVPEEAQKIKHAAGGIMSKYDFNEYGGAPMLGVGGIWIICHGASDHRGIKNAVRVAAGFAKCRVNEQITELLGEQGRADE